jgi:sugar O-acyltransferase (sialic acid O-acetyltransferase NeuD family)
MKPIQIAIYGAGGFARELAWLAESCNEPQAGASAQVRKCTRAQERERYRVVCFIDDKSVGQDRMMNGIPVLGLEDCRTKFPDARVLAGVGKPATRELLMDRTAQLGLKTLSLIHPRVERSALVEIGEGTVICAGSILTTNIKLGRHVQVNLGCTIGHDVDIGDFATLSPGVHVSGWVRLGKRVFVGTGAVIVNGTEENPLKIGDDAVVGAAACVTRSVAAGLTVVGVPARPTGNVE